MVRWIVGSSLKFRLLVVPLAAALIVAGIIELRKAPVDVLPEYTLPVVEVQTESLGLSAPEVEQLITVPMEQDLLNGVMGVDTIRSDSVPGLSDITMIFERGTNIFQARQLVQERLTQAHALPNVSKPPQMLQPMSSTSRAMMIGLSTTRLSPIELSVLARWTVKPRLMGLPGVANVAIWGYRDRQLQVKTDPARLALHHVSLSQLLRTTGNAQLVSPLTFVEASTPGTGGFLDGPNQRLGVRHIVPFGKPSNLAQVPIEGNRSLSIGDVANVTEDHQPLIGDAVVGGNHGLLLVVQKLPSANTLKVTHEVEDALDEMRPGLAGVQIDSHVFRPASFIEEAMSNLGTLAIIAAALALLALVAFVMQWRAVLVSVVALPLSLLAALFVVRLTGETINALVVAGLVVALGAVIGDAIGDVDAIAARLRDERAAGAKASTMSAVFEASARTRSAMGFATLILLVAIMPVFFAGGTSGAFVHSLALSYGLAVLASMAVALTVTPVLSTLVYARLPRRTAAIGLAARLSRAWDGLLTRGLRTPRPALYTLGGLLLVGLAVLPFLGQSLHPSFKDRDILVQWSATPSTSLPEMERITTRATRELQSLPGVRDAGAHVGRAVTGDQAIGTGSGQIWVSIDRSADYDKTLRSIRGVVGGYPGLRGRVETYESDRTRGVLTPADHRLVVRLYGEDYGVLSREARNVSQVVSGVKGVEADPRILTPATQPTLQIEPSITEARRYGLKPGDVRRAAGTLVNGLEAGSFFEGQKVFSVVVQGVGATRSSVTSIENLLIDTPGGGHVALGKVARVQITPSPVNIRHFGVERYVDVTAGVSGRSLGAVQSDVRQRIERMHFPLEFNAEVIKPSEDVQAPASRFLSLAIAAIIGIFLLLQAAFGSWRLATLVFFASPVALIGGLLAVLAGGGDISLGAAFGLVAVGGIAVRNAILLITHLQELSRREGETFGLDLVVRGVRERFAPIVTTAAVTAAALAPFAIAGDIAGNEITHSTAVVVLGGLVTVTVLSLFLFPALYLHFGHSAREPAPLRAPTPSAPVPQVELNV
jgi:Cu/Ag efflux pump CusA